MDDLEEMVTPEQRGRRVQLARVALIAFSDYSRLIDYDDPDDRADPLCDLLANLMHWVGEEEFDAALERGRYHYNSERQEP